MPVFSERDKEKIHWMLYDSNPGDPRTLLGKDEEGGLPRAPRNGKILEFFTDVSRKTKLETNMETAGRLTDSVFEAHALHLTITPLTEYERAGSSAATSAAPVGDDVGFNPRVIEEFIYNSVTTLRIRKKTYVEAPTFLFPSGAGASGAFGGNGSSGASYGVANPMATWRFAEPIVIPPQQSFRVQISFPHGVQRLTHLREAAIRVWMILDGYLTRDVQ
jgi:hypothetical protein